MLQVSMHCCKSCRRLAPKMTCTVPTWAWVTMAPSHPPPSSGTSLKTLDGERTRALFSLLSLSLSLSLSVCLPLCLSLYLSVSVCLYPSVSLSVLISLEYSSISLFLCLCLSASVSVSLFQSLSLSVCPYLCPSLCVYIVNLVVVTYRWFSDISSHGHTYMYLYICFGHTSCGLCRVDHKQHSIFDWIYIFYFQPNEMGDNRIKNKNKIAPAWLIYPSLMCENT